MKKFKLPATAAVPWMYESLSKGPSLTLAKTVAALRQLDGYSFTTFASDATSNDKLIDFSTGGKSDATSADEWLFSFLIRTASEYPIQILAEDWRATRGNEFLTRLKFPAVYFGDETYYLLRPKQRPLHEQETRIFSNTVPTFHAFAFEEDPHLLVGMSLSLNHLRRVANGVKAIICGAYDGESFVVATRQVGEV